MRGSENRVSAEAAVLCVLPCGGFCCCYYYYCCCYYRCYFQTAIFGDFSDIFPAQYRKVQAGPGAAVLFWGTLSVFIHLLPFWCR